MKTKQTAVEWLIEQIYDQKILDGADQYCYDTLDQLHEQALQMEKEQITDSYIMGSYDMAEKEFRPEQYYNEIYGKQN